MSTAIAPLGLSRSVRVPSGRVLLEGELEVPDGAVGLVLFAHGSGSSRHSPRNQFVARTLQASRVGTLLMHLLTPDEEEIDEATRHLRFDIGLLAERLIAAFRFTTGEPETRDLATGFFGASTGAAAAL